MGSQDTFGWHWCINSPGIFASDCQSSFGFFSHNLLLSQEHVYIWIWRFSFQHRKFGHLQDFLCSSIGNRICSGCIYSHLRVLVCPKTSLNKIYFFQSLIFSVVLEVSLEVVSISLFFFSQVIRKNCVRIVPSLISSVQHSLLSSCVVDWVHVFSELMSSYLVWNLVNFLNCLSNFLMTTSALIKFS